MVFRKTKQLAIGAVLAWAAVAGAAEAAKSKLDELVYNDGDRIYGHFVSRSKDVIVFKSERWGMLRVLASNAKVVLAGVAMEPKTAGPAAPEQAVAKRDTERTGSEAAPNAEPAGRWANLSPVALALKLREFFGPWNGRVALSTEIVTDTTSRRNVMAETTLKRQWVRDEVQLGVRYDYSETNRVVTTDIVKGSGSWRHDFPNPMFGIYRPTVEVNYAFKDKTLGVQTNYVLLQQELGAGFNVMKKPGRQLRLGASENLFDVWVLTPFEQHTAENVESLFMEAEWRLPWRATLTNRGVFYYSVTEGSEGWENKFEISKKLTETLSVAMRHEIRRNNPDVRVQDYRLLKLLVGLDF